MIGNGVKCVPTTNDLQRMQDALNDMIRSRCDSREEHQYHLDQMKSYMESQIVSESRQEDLTLQITKKPAPELRNKEICTITAQSSCIPVPENDLEELNTIWVRKIIKRFNLYARYVVDHWKRLWAKKSHIIRQLKKRDDPEEVYS
ncbi:hypothetical protein Tco_1170982 [Tanacetum coccineum]